MPKPDKGENKQDFLKRCTAEIMQQEGKEADQAYAMCNMAWDNSKSQRAALTLSAPLTLAAGEEAGPKEFLITAFTGAIIENWWGKLVISTAGIQVKGKMPVLREHARDRVVGFSTKAWIEGDNLLLQGNFSGKTRDGQEVQDLMAEGFPWQASIGVWPKKLKVLESDKETETVNGRKIAGPAEIWLESYVREVSFCALGADDETAAISLAEDKTKVPVTIERAGPKNKEEAMPITLQQLEAEAPALLKEIRDKAQAEVTLEALLAQKPEAADQLRAEGQQTERTRVVEILEADGDPKVALEAVKSGAALGEAFKLFFRAEKDGREQALTSMARNAPSALGQKPGQNNPVGETFEAKVQELVQSKGLKRSAAIIQAARDFPELHAAYIARHNPEKK